ncbi:hypothetical protein PENSPDRAFT_83369 [Peniophora sp. CONT]|nr:hypothetical protein PENSPDRAFT_83369 [Peniophora sp. CONT]
MNTLTASALAFEPFVLFAASLGNRVHQRVPSRPRFPVTLGTEYSRQLPHDQVGSLNRPVYISQARVFEASSGLLTLIVALFLYDVLEKLPRFTVTTSPLSLPTTLSNQERS